MAIINYEIDLTKDLMISTKKQDGDVCNTKSAMDDDRFKTPYVMPFRITICCISIGAVVMMIKRHLVKNEWITKYSQEKLGEVA